MLVLTALLCHAAWVAEQEPGALAVLRVGEAVQGEMTGEEGAVSTPVLDARSTRAPTVGQSFLIQVDESGPYHVDLRSYFFDGYLVLRDAAGRLLAEDDDGWIGVHARLAAELEAGRTYRLQACALHGRRGAFELALRRGRPDELSPDARRRLEREDAERRLEAVESLLGPAHHDTLHSVDALAGLLASQGDLHAARALYERAVAMREEILGAGHPGTAASLSHLAGTLHRLGDHGAARPLYERVLATYEDALGPDHPNTATALHNLAGLLKDLGDYGSARPLQERALATFERVLGPDHPLTARGLDHLAGLHEALGDYGAARPLYERALATCERVLGPDHPGTAASLNNLALLLQAQGDLGAARPLAERALSIREAAHGPEHPAVATSLNNLALLLKRQGQLAAARPLYERALAIREKVLGPEHPRTATSLENLAGLLEAGGDLDSARPLFERALAIQEELLGPEHPRTATSLENLAGLLREQGRYRAARPLAERALAICEQALGADHPDTATRLNNLALLLAAQGEHDAARSSYERALAIRERVLGPEHPDSARSRDNLAGLLQAVGDFEAARPLAERALATFERVLGTEHPDTATSLNNLAVLLHEQGDLAAARPLAERALAISEKVLGPEHPATATALGNLASLLKDQGEHDAARALAERGVAICEQVLGPEHPETALGLGNLAVLLHEQGDYHAALPLAERALATWESVFGPEHPLAIRGRINLAGLLADLDEPLRAWETIASDRDRRARPYAPSLALLTEAERYAYLAQVRWYLELELSLSLLLEDAGVRVAAYEALLDWKGRVTRTLLASRGRLSAGMTPEQRDLLAELHESQRRLSALTLRTSVRDPKGHQTQVRAAREERNRVELELQRALASATAAAAPASVDALREALPDRSVLLDFFAHRTYQPARWEAGELETRGRWGESRVSVWITRPDRPEPLRLDLGSTEQIERAIRDRLARIAGAPPAEGAERTSGRLEALLWDPLAPHLEGAELVLVSPDSPLASLPFGTLELADGRYAVERFAFVYLQDLGALTSAAGAREPGPDSLLAVGAVDFGRRSGPGGESGGAPVVEGSTAHGAFRGTWAPLPATERESRLVFDLHGEALGTSGRRLLLQGAEATEERLERELPRHAILHLATHGFFNPEGVHSLWDAALEGLVDARSRLGGEMRHLYGKHPGLLTGLVCAGASTGAPPGRDDGYLTAEELGWLDLSGVQLVVLSACETALGRPQSGEGLLGLQRACLTAGADTVISSLWSVGDDSTWRLMRAFYTHLLERGLGRLEALRGAQLSMLQSNREQYGEGLPRTWGGFVLSGEWR